jgi:hypothetical protein
MANARKTGGTRRRTRLIQKRRFASREEKNRRPSIVCPASKPLAGRTSLDFLVSYRDNSSQMLPDWFPEAVQYFVVPIGVLLIAYGYNHQFRLKYSSGSDFFVFFVSLDLNALIVYDAYKERINPVFADNYLPVFVFLAVVSLILLGVTLRTQGTIEDWRSARIKEYPVGRVFACWFSTTLLIPTHLYVFFGRR